MATRIRSICYVDFAGNLDLTACGEPVPDDLRLVTVFMSAATCPACQHAIQLRLARVPLPAHSAGGGLVSASSRTARI